MCVQSKSTAQVTFQARSDSSHRAEGASPSCQGSATSWLYCRGPYCVMGCRSRRASARQGLVAHRLEQGVADFRALGWRVQSEVRLNPPKRRASPEDIRAIEHDTQRSLWPAENLAQFVLLIVVNAFVGAMVGLERTIPPAIAEHEFHLAAKSAVLSFIIVFGVTKALTNYFQRDDSRIAGRKHVLVAGWLVAAPVPFLLMWAPNWSLMLAGNALPAASTKGSLVHNRHHEDRPCGLGATRTGNGPQRVCGVLRGRGSAIWDRLYRREVRAATTAILSRRWIRWRSAWSYPWRWCAKLSTTSPPSPSCTVSCQGTDFPLSDRSSGAPRCSIETSQRHAGGSYEQPQRWDGLGLFPLFSLRRRWT